MPICALLLAVALVAVCVYAISQDEMAYLSATISVVSVIASLVLAPWQLKLLILVVVLLGQRLGSGSFFLRELLTQNQVSASIASPVENRQSNQAPTETKITLALDNQEKKQGLVLPKSRVTFELKYRGATEPKQRDVVIPQRRSSYQLKYRGVSLKTPSHES